MNWFRKYIQRIAGYERTLYKFHALECMLDELEKRIDYLEKTLRDRNV